MSVEISNGPTVVMPLKGLFSSSGVYAVHP